MKNNGITWQAYELAWPPQRIHEANYKGIRAVAYGGRTPGGKQGYSISFDTNGPIVKKVADDLVVLDGLNEALKQGAARLKEVAADHGHGAAE